MARIRKSRCVFRPSFSAIARLLLARGPFAVTRLIIAIIIDAFNLKVARRPFSHILKEGLKRLAPPLANSYPATSIPRIADIYCHFASTNHRPPAFVGRAFCHAVLNAPSASYVARKAAAASRAFADVLMSQSSGRAKREASAVAMTEPNHKVCFGSSSKPENSESRESLSSQIDDPMVKFRKVGRLGRINSSHEIFLSREGRLWLEPSGVTAPCRLASFYQKGGAYVA